jgi:cytochrome c peroxidase
VDPGRAEIPALQSSCADVGAFRTPTLRNVALTAPYMHNGTLPSLGTVVGHYEALAEGAITPVVGELDRYVRKDTMRFGAGGGEAQDVRNMIAFLQALTGSQRPGPTGGVAPPHLK